MTTQYPAASPIDVERRLYELEDALTSAVVEVQQGETDYYTAKTSFDLSFARAYLNADGKNQKEKEARALIACEEERWDLTRAEALVRAHKENVRRLYVQVDIARSISVIVRAGMGAS